MFKKLIFPSTVIAALILVGLLWWQFPSKPEMGLKTTGLPIKVAHAYWPGMYWIDIAEKKGWFQEAGLNVKLINYEDYFKSIDDMVKGKIDVHGFSLFDVVNFNSKGADLTLVNYQGTSSGSQAILAGEETKTINELRGKRIGVNKNNYLEYILDVVLEKNGLTLNDVILVDISGEKAPEALTKGLVDAVVTWVPHIEEILKKGNTRKLFDTSEIPGLVPNGSAFHQSFIQQRPHDVQAFINVWHKTMLFIMEHPKDAFEIIAKTYKVSPDAARQFVQLEPIMNLRSNLTAFTYAAGFESLHGAARKINDFMIKKKMTVEELDSTTLLDDRFIQALKWNLKKK
ncbi:MAG: hypothetical protein COB67_10145 [SAR324 cluster bacterium]|uniref:SsuA/THI5-like domain-containing protein n=1 Tax=SAR324 cluster bacterium TaxID=2024889 RepID=A0A2A4SYW7_9DELT|nr:MAG: hypothetical protein COB67_10145 [SAR324 cluster bacterium]